MAKRGVAKIGYATTDTGNVEFGWRKAMAMIQFRRLSIEEAENCIAEIWTCLEEYQLPSPKMYFDCPEGSGITMTINVDDPVAENTLLARLSGYSGVNGILFSLPPEAQDNRLDRPLVADDGAGAPLGVILSMATPA